MKLPVFNVSHGTLVSRCRAEYQAGSRLVVAVQQCDGLVIEAVSQSLSPGYDVPVPSPLDSIRVNRPWLG